MNDKDVITGLEEMSKLLEKEYDEAAAEGKGDAFVDLNRSDELKQYAEHVRMLSQEASVRKQWLDERTDALCRIAHVMGEFYRDADDGSLDFKNLHLMVKEMMDNLKSRKDG